MIKVAIIAAGIIFWISVVLQLLQFSGKFLRGKQIILTLERVGLFVFTAGLVFYISKLEIVAQSVRFEKYDLPVSFLLFTWCLIAANLVSEISYNNRYSSFFTNLWAALALTISPSAAQAFRGLFTDDLQWLSFYRLCFLLGYSFCLMALPMAAQYFYVSRQKEGNVQANSTTLYSLDRMMFRMILLALPLLTAGIVAEAVVLLETNQFPSPEELITHRLETALAIGTWALCGLYLHCRLFFGWKEKRVAVLYLFGLCATILGHILHGLSRT